MSAWNEAKAADGRTYYYIPGTNQVTWDKPEGYDAAPATPATPGPGEGTWKEAKSAEGKTYYYNAVTNQTAWQLPEGARLEQAQSAAPAFVAGGAQTNDDNFRQRDRRRDDRDNGLPQKSGFDGERGGAPWQQRQEHTGFRGPMPVKVDEPDYSTYEQAEEAFFKVFRKHDISPDTPWVDALRQVLREKDYRAIKNPAERRQAYDKYCVQVREEERAKEKERREKVRGDFRHMLTTHEDIKHYTRWKTARPWIEREVVFKNAGDEDERRQMFDEYVFDLKKKHGEDELTMRRSAMEDLESLLHVLILDANVTWNDARQSIESNERFANEDKFRTLSKADVLGAFDAHIKQLDYVANEEKQDDKKLQYRRDRQSRDQFKQLLSEMKGQGKLTAVTKWKDFYPLIAQDDRYLNQIGTTGSTPLELFADVVEDEERKLRSSRNLALDVLEDRRYEVSIDTGLEEFANIMRSDPRTASFDQGELRMVYEKIMDKIKKRADEDKAHNERHQRKAVDTFRGLLKRVEPPIRASDTYIDWLPRFSGYEEFQALDEEVAKSAFEKHVRRLKEKEDDYDRERPRRERDRPHRNGSRSRRDYDRERDRYRTLSPEIDAYEADRRKAQADRERQYRKASFGLTPPPRERREERDDRYRRHDRHEGLSVYDRERREREEQRERSYVSRADPRDKARTLDYGDEDDTSSRPGSIRKRRESDGSAGGRDSKRARRSDRGRTRTPTAEPSHRGESPALQSGSEEGEIEEV